jgi:hypothetical protein
MVHTAATIGVVLAATFTAALADTVRMNRIVPDYIEGDLELAISPQPQVERLSDRMIPVDGVTIVLPQGGDAGKAPEQLADLFGESTDGASTRVLVGDAKRNPQVADVIKQIDFPSTVDDKGEEAYQLYVGADPAKEGNQLILLAGNSPAGDFWALQSLRQLTASKDGKTYVRRGAVSDWPMFWGRGNKRPEAWEHRFKANYAWSMSKTGKSSTRTGAEPAMMDGLFRNRGGVILDGRAIDYGEPADIEAVKEKIRSAYESGIREFTFKWDDAPYVFKAKARKKYEDYFQAQADYNRTMFEFTKGLDKDNTVYFMFQPYWTNAGDIHEYGEAMKKHNGIPPGAGLSFTGPEVTASSIDIQDVTLAEKTLGYSGDVKAQIYDNYGRGGDLFAYHGRDPKLHTEVKTIFQERGTPVTRITTYDYLWNPENYDPERALKLAVRELAGRDPKTYESLWDFVTTWNERRDKAAFLATPQLARTEHVASTKRLRQKFDTVAPMLEQSPLAKAAGYPQRLIKGENWGESAALLTREQHVETMARYGYKFAEARKVEDAKIRLDGKMDEAAWRQAQVLDGFLKLGWTAGEKEPMATPVMPEDKQTEVRTLWDDEYLYVFVTFHHTQPVFKEGKKAKHPAGTRADLAWREPNIEICLDRDRDRDDYYQIMPNLHGWYAEGHYRGTGDPERPHATVRAPQRKPGTDPIVGIVPVAEEGELPGGSWFDSNIEFATNVGEATSTMEVRIPFAKIGGAPKAGDLWGAQFNRGKLDGYSTWTFMYDFGGFRTPNQFGTLQFVD